MTPEKRNKIKALMANPAATENEKQVCRKILADNPEPKDMSESQEERLWKILTANNRLRPDPPVNGIFGLPPDPIGAAQAAQRQAFAAQRNAQAAHQQAEAQRRASQAARAGYNFGGGGGLFGGAVANPAYRAAQNATNDFFKELAKILEDHKKK